MPAKQREISSESIISRWKYLPYQRLFKDRRSAERLFLSRFTDMSTADLYAGETGERMALLRALDGETKILGLKCARLEPLVLNVKDELSGQSISESGRFIRDVITRANEKKGFEHISCVVDCADNHTQLALSSAGFSLADTILGYHIDVTNASLGEKDTFVRDAQKSDLQALSQITYRCFATEEMSKNRFACEPAFEPDAVGKLYSSWIEGAVLRNQADKVFVFDDGQVSGYMTFKLPSAVENEVGLKLGKAVLSGVSPERHGLGIYKRLLCAGVAWLRANAVESIEGKTQITTIPAIRAWQKQGRLNVVYHTFHWSNRGKDTKWM